MAVIATFLLQFAAMDNMVDVQINEGMRNESENPNDPSAPRRATVKAGAQA